MIVKTRMAAEAPKQGAKWEMGAQCEVYSHSKKRWMRGVVQRVYSNNEGDWVIIDYDGETKHSSIDDADIRLPSDNNPVNQPKQQQVQDLLSGLNYGGVVLCALSWTTNSA